MAPVNKKTPRIIAYKTAIFQIHSPTKRRRSMLHDALYRYHLGFTKMLKLALENADALKALDKGKFDTHLNSLMAGKLNSLPLSNAGKAGLAQDISATISSYLELLRGYEKNSETLTPEEIEKKGGRPSPPSIPRLLSADDDWKARLYEMRMAVSLEEETMARDRLLTESKAGHLRPMFFPRCRVNGGFMILKNTETENYYIFLNLHSSKSRWAKRHSVDLKGLMDVRDGTVQTQKTKTGELFPINFGKDHQLEGFIKSATPKTAKLIKKTGPVKGECFEVHVAFEFSAPKRETNCFLGVDRGINNLASLCVIDLNGKIISEENIDGRDLRFVQRKLEQRQRTIQKSGKIFKNRTRLAEADKAVHRTANKIVELAHEFSAQVVLENLQNFSNRRSKRGRSNFNRMLNRTQFQKLEFVLDYKLQLAGLPKCRRVHPAYTSMTCPECGFCDKANRDRKDKQNRFICGRCGYRHDADLNAARVIALKKCWRDFLSAPNAKKTFAELANTRYSFESYLKSLVEQHS